MTYRMELAETTEHGGASFVFAGEGNSPTLDLTRQQWQELGGDVHPPVVLNVTLEPLYPSLQELDRAAGRAPLPDRHDVWLEGFRTATKVDLNDDEIAAANPYEAGELE